ncbi:hypothetical protein [Herbiconiux ginsengi]|uniref:Uncharacterized protein n=1 Tax=Herbiconiux ginsengi TaxID=381665 RepID=A0A1H3L642_9MICO|nr:hypothetical protein [Herbiconiux ginsengi]SDY59851.1 hypothetical protein SAMN05216554_0845 [Herbiconiux ginsengi]
MTTPSPPDPTDIVSAHRHRRLSVDEIVPERVAEMLRAAQRIERAATGPSVRVAFRNTRILIGAVHANGYSLQRIAAVLGTDTQATRARIEPGGLLVAGDLATLLCITQAELDECFGRWHLAPVVTEQGYAFYGAEELVKAILGEEPGQAMPA